MSWTDEEIDKLARESAANSSVEYKNAYWTEFEAMLPVTGKKDFLWFFTAFLFVGLMGTSFVFNGLVKDNGIISASKKNESRNLEENVDLSIDEINDSENEKGQVNNNDLGTKEDQNSFNSPNSTGNSKTVKSNSTKTFHSAKGNKSGENFNFAKGNTGTDPFSQFFNEDKSGNDPNHPNEGIGPVSKLNDNSSEINKSTLAENSRVSNLPLRSLNEFGHYTSLMPGMDFSKQKLPARASFYINGFGGLSQSLITPSNDISTSFGLGLGAQIQKGRFTFTTGVNGVWSNHKDLNLSRSAKVYGFGSNEYNYQFKYQQIYLLEAELTAGYKMGRHLINIGVRPSYVIGTKVGVVESVNDQKTLDRNVYGYVDGLHRFGIKPTLGYSFDITRTFKIGLNIGVEMMQKIQDGFLVGSSNPYPIDGQLYLRKSISFKSK